MNDSDDSSLSRDGSSAVSPAGIQELQRLVAGPVLVPGDEGYDEEVAGFNVAVRHSPAVVVGATGTEDVRQAVLWAGERDLAVTVQATGHGATTAARDGLLVSTRRMQDLSIDPETRLATIGAGVKWGTVIVAAAQFGLVPLNGSSGDVGAVGYTLGGGLPVLGRTFGFASDRVHSFELVTADGRARSVSADREPDLFWALKGGKAQVGIVTSMTVELLPLRTIYGGGIFYPGAEAPAVLHAFREWAGALPDSATSSVALLRLPPIPDVPEPLRGQFVVHLRYAHVGDPAEGERILAPMRGAAPDLMDTVREMPYTEVDSIHQDPTHPLPFRECGAMLEDLTPEAVDALLSVAGPASDTPLLMVEVRRLGGALGRPPEVGDAVGIRGVGYSVFLLGLLLPELAEAVPAALVAAVAEIAPYATGATFVNFHGEPASAEDVGRPWPADVRRRLAEIKQAADPDGRFRFAHSFVGQA